MKLTPIENELALKIITKGEPKPFTIFEYKGTSYTIYHRDYEGKHYDILEIVVYDEVKQKEVSSFNVCDPEELKVLFRKSD